MYVNVIIMYNIFFTQMAQYHPGNLRVKIFATHYNNYIWNTALLFTVHQTTFLNFDILRFPRAVPSFWSTHGTPSIPPSLDLQRELVKKYSIYCVIS